VKITYVSQYFPPEMGAPAARVSELSRRWAARGHDVQVLTSFPHHPTGIVPPAYRGHVRLREHDDDVEVLRTFVYATPNKGVVRRGLAYLSFAMSAVALGGIDRRVRETDVIVATSPQFLCAVAGWALAKLTRKPFVLEIRDLWPQSIVEVGAMPASHPVVAMLRWIEAFLYREADLLVSVTDSFPAVWRAQGVDPDKIRVVKNGVDLRRFTPRDPPATVRADLGVADDAFVVAYIGTHGLAHKLEVLLDVADRLRHRPRVQLLFVGEGAQRAALVARAEAMGLPNVHFVGERPRDAIPDLLAASDLVAVVLKRADLFRHVIPSKMFEIMGCARPILLGVEGEAEGILREADAGWAVPPEDVDAMVAAIETALADPVECRRRGEAGRRYVEANFDRDRLADDYAVELEQLVTSRRGAGPRSRRPRGPDGRR
jgi:glycosyltransferase involved in cell wall biosynthesis